MKKLVLLTLGILSMSGLRARGQADQTAQKQLTLTVVAATNGTHSVVLKWGAVTTCVDGSACTPTGYKVYRSSTGTGYTTPLATVTTTTYTNANITGTQTLYYVVTAYLPACVAGHTTPCGESQYSNEAQAVIP